MGPQKPPVAGRLWMVIEGHSYPIVIDLTCTLLRGIICRFARSATELPGLVFCERTWAHQDLNLGPTDYESAALTN